MNQPNTSAIIIIDNVQEMMLKIVNNMYAINY